MWSDIPTMPLQGQWFRMMRAIIMNFPGGYDEKCRQDQNDDTKQMMIPKNESVASSQECIGNKAKKPPKTLWNKVRPRIPEENRAKILLTLPQPKDTKRIPKAYDQGRTKKVRWEDLTRAGQQERR